MRYSTAPEFLKIGEVSELLRVPVKTLYHWRYVGKGPKAFNTGRQLLYPRTEIDRWISNSTERS